MEIKDNTLSTWKSKYCDAIKEYQKAGKYADSGEIVVTSLPSKKRGRPLLIGDKFDKQVQSYICATHDEKGAVIKTVDLAAGEAILKHCNKKLSYDNGGPIKLTRYWAKSLLDYMNYIKQKATNCKN